MANLRKIFPKIFGISLGIVALVWVFYDIDFKLLAKILKKTNIGLLSVPIILTFFVIFLKVIRWHIIVEPKFKSLNFSGIFLIYLSGLLGNIFLPFRAGDILRAKLLNFKVPNIGVTSAISAVICERVIDGFTLIPFLILSFIKLAQSYPFFKKMILLFFLLLLIFGIFPLLSFLITKHLNIPSFLSKFLEKVQEGFLVLTSLRHIGVVLLLSFAIWLLQIGAIYATMISVGLKSGFLICCVVLVFINLSIVLPNAPANIGVFQFACILALTSFGIDKVRALGFSLVLFLCQILPIIACGFSLSPFHKKA